MTCRQSRAPQLARQLDAVLRRVAQEPSSTLTRKTQSRVAKVTPVDRPVRPLVGAKSWTIYLWVFIWAVVLLDIGFALVNGTTFTQWEANPLAAGLGLYGACLLRLLSMVCAYLLMARAGFPMWGSVATAGIHLFLLAVYVQLLF
jgi:hypothetical protein